ncbi:hypothetical protein TWF730_005214 [Orbilia blumenaviensis]|uniref:Uncharacterized protein n=1 Tax=Orbilia blumenaviensis TaxID=1796055 RepID=A0AAV9VNU6_9PEZI
MKNLEPLLKTLQTRLGCFPMSRGGIKPVTPMASKAKFTGMGLDTSSNHVDVGKRDPEPHSHYPQKQSVDEVHAEDHVNLD